MSTKQPAGPDGAPSIGRFHCMYIMWCLCVCCPWLLPSACRLVDALRDFGYLDWQFSALVCKTLWNYSDKMTSSLSCFGAEETELLIKQLEVYLGVELRMCVTLCMCVCVWCVCVCTCMQVCIQLFEDTLCWVCVLPVLQMRIRASCGVCPWRSPWRDKSIPPWYVEEWVLSSGQSTLGACEDTLLWSYTTIVWRSVRYYINSIVIGRYWWLPWILYNL